MKYLSVRRVLVDTCVKIDRGCVSRIYFQLNYPVEIRKFQKKPVPNGRTIREGDRYRYAFFAFRNDDSA